MSIRNLSLGVVLADQISKYLVLKHFHMNDSVTLIQDYLYLTYIQNPGAAFGFMAESPVTLRVPFFIAITVGAGLIVYAYQRFVPLDKKWMRAALGLIWGGAMGNFVDRVIHGKVVDFIDVTHIHFLPIINIGSFHLGPNFPWIFNLADSCITVGIVLLLFSHFFEKTHPVPGSY